MLPIIATTDVCFCVAPPITQVALRIAKRIRWRPVNLQLACDLDRTQLHGTAKTGINIERRSASQMTPKMHFM